MAFGTLGSTLNDELNRLANGGTYRDKSAMVDEALAAKQWANRENIIPYSTDTVGILNEIAALGPNRQNWYDFNGVCNYLAGTTGLPAAAALRQITTTGDILTSLASYYVDAATPTNWGSLGYVTLPGVNGNYLSVPDASNLDITGDIDIRVQVAMDDWTPAATTALISKANVAGSNFSFTFRVNTNGTLNFVWTENGGTTKAVTSTVAPTVTDGATLWVRVTFDVDNGASGNTATFYTSTNGTSWTQLGDPVVTAATTSIFSSISPVEIGSLYSGTSSPLAGKVYRAQVLNGIGGTTVLDVNIASNFTSSSFNTFTATTGQTVTVNGVDTLTNGGTAGSLLPTTVGSSLAADSNDPKFLAHTGTNYVYTPGVAVNVLDLASSAALQITGDLDLRVDVALDNYNSTDSQNILLGKVTTSGTVKEYVFQYEYSTLSGQLALVWRESGGTTRTARATASTSTITNGTRRTLRATLDVDNGAGQYEVKFFSSTDNITWTQIGATVTGATGVTNVGTGTGNVSIAATPSTTGGTFPTAGKIYRAQILNGIDGTTVLDVDTSVITTGAATSFTAVTGQTVTINRSTSGRKTVAVTQPTWLFGTDDYMEVNNRYMAHSTAAENYVYLPGASGNYMSVADNPPLDVTGDLDLRVQVALDDWTPGSSTNLIDKWTSPSNLSYVFLINTSGNLVFAWTTSGASGTQTTTTSTVTNGVTDGTIKWVRVTLDVDNGASGNDVKFWTSNDGTTWTQLGATITNSGVSSVYSGAAPVALGANTNGAGSNLRGKFYRAQIRNGIDGTIVLDADASVITLPSQTTFVDRSSNAYTVTINKSGVGTFVSTGNYLYLPGIAGNWATSPDSAALDITGDIDVRVKIACDDWTPAANSGILAKDDAGEQAYYFRLNTTGTLTFQWITSGAVTVEGTSTVATGIADGATKWVRTTLDVDNGASGYDLKFWLSDDGITWTQLGTTITVAGVTNIRATLGQLSIGNRRTSTDLFRGKIFRAQVLNGIGGTLVFDANFESSITSLLQTSFTESSTNGATVTINRSGSTFRSAGVIDAGYLYPGATNTFSNSTTDFLNMGANQDFTVVTISRQFGTTNPAFAEIIAKHNSADFSPGYAIVLNASGVTASFATPDGTNKGTAFAQGYTSGNLATYTGYRSGSTVALSLNAANPTTATGSTNTLSNIHPLRIGRNSVGLLYHDMEFIGAAVFRTALTATQIRQISNYFANREVYL